MRKIILLPVIIAAIFSSNCAFAKNPAKLFKQLTCVTCHGQKGRGMIRRRDRLHPKTGKLLYKKGDLKKGYEAYPKLAGQNVGYLIVQLKDILAGRRNNGKTSKMLKIKPLIDKLTTEDDLKAITSYLSKIK